VTAEEKFRGVTAGVLAGGVTARE